MEITAACRAFCVESREWTEGAVAPMVLGVAHAASAVLGGRLYVAGGVYTEGLRRGLEDESDLLQVYDVQTGWSASKIDLPSDAFFGLFPGSRAGVALGDDTLVVVCGGSREHHVVDDADGPDDDDDGPGGGGLRFELVEAAPRTYAYDVDGRAWRPLPPLPALREAFSAAAHGGRVYVVGGVCGERGAPPLVLDPAARQWRELDDAPAALSRLERPAVASVVLG